jgi:NDP-sugar pyrophosphorylase family protein
MKGAVRPPVRAMILAAGLGERMRPLSARLAKPALPILNRPLILEIARRLARAGVRELVVNVHHCAATVREALSGAAELGLAVRWSEEPERPLGTGGGVRRARPLLEGAPFLLVNGDSLPGVDFSALARAHARSKCAATLVVRPLREGEAYRPVEADENGRLWRIAGRPASPPSPLAAPRGLRQYVFTGVHLIEPEILKFLPEREVFDINHDVYPAALAAGRALSVYDDPAPWHEIGDPDRYLAASLAVLEAGGIEEAPEARRGEGVYVGPEVGGLDAARLQPPVWIGERTDLGPGARLRRCVVGPGCVIGERAEIEDCVLMARVRVGAGARLLGVVAESDVEVPEAVEVESQVLTRDGAGLAAARMGGR